MTAPTTTHEEQPALQESDDAVDDWENADFDEIVDKIKDNKEDVKARILAETEEKVAAVDKSKATGAKPAS